MRTRLKIDTQRGSKVGAKIRRPTGSALPEAETEALAARFTTPPTGDRKNRINALIRSLKGAGVWQKLDAFYMLAAAEEQAAQMNWIADQYNLSVVGSLTHTADRGYQGNDSGYLATSATRSALTNFAQNSACLGGWTLSETNDDFIIGTITAGTARLLTRFNGNAGARLNSASGTTVAIATSAGLTVASRTAADLVTIYRDGASIFSNSAASASLTADVFSIYKDGTNLYSGLGACVFFGSGLTDQDVAATYQALRTYLVAVGAVS